MKINKYVVQFGIIQLPAENVFCCVDIKMQDNQSSLEIFQGIIEEIIPRAQDMLDKARLKQVANMNSVNIKTLSLIDSEVLSDDEGDYTKEIVRMRNNG